MSPPRHFCHRHFNGRFLDHIPEIVRKHDGSIERTAHVIEANGFDVDWSLWEADYGRCTPCRPRGDCHRTIH
jgi:hypothetical protein